AQEFDVAQSQALNASKRKTDPPQQPERRADGSTLAKRPDCGEGIAGEDDFDEAKPGDREIEPVWNDAVTNIDPGQHSAQDAQQCKRQQDDHPRCLLRPTSRRIDPVPSPRATDRSLRRRCGWS